MVILPGPLLVQHLQCLLSVPFVHVILVLPFLLSFHQLHLDQLHHLLLSDPFHLSYQQHQCSPGRQDHLGHLKDC